MTASDRIVSPRKHWRLFVAVDLGTDGQRVFSAAVDAGRRAAIPARWVDSRLAHLTLVFLGDTLPDRVGAIGRALIAVAARYPTLPLTTGPLGAFPNARTPRVIWIGVEEPAGRLRQLQRDLATALRALDLPLERGPYHPHLTVARARHGSGIPAPALAAARAAFAHVPPASFPVRALQLIRSELGRDGPRYTSLLTAPVAAGGE